VTTDDGPGSANDARKYVLDPGFYADPGGQPGMRYWNGQGWSPLLPPDFDLADPAKVGNFTGLASLPLPERDGTWMYAAQMARKAGISTASFAALTVLALAVALAVPSVRSLLFVAALGAFRTLGQWRVRRRWIKLDRAAAGPVSWGQHRQEPGDADEMPGVGGRELRGPPPRPLTLP
jgi:hypothetical protein